MTINPIWRTIELDMTSQLSSGSVDFAVYLGSSTSGTLIYSGKAYADAGGNCKVRLNDIFKNYLGDASLDLDSVEDYNYLNIVRQFYVTYGASGTATYKVVNDWSYETITRTDQSAGFLNDPITGFSGNNGWVTLTFFGVSRYTYYYFDDDGNVQESGVNITPQGDTTTLFFIGEGPGDLEVQLTPAGGGSTIWRTFPVSDDCNTMALTYRNKYGGYDTLQLASCVENKAYTRNTYEAGGVDSSRSALASLRTPSESVTRTFTLRTPVLTDAQAAKMDNVLGTTQAWLNTLELGTVAVNMNTASWKKKTFKNEGRKRVVYEFEVQYAQSMERR